MTNVLSQYEIFGPESDLTAGGCTCCSRWAMAALAIASAGMSPLPAARQAVHTLNQSCCGFLLLCHPCRPPGTGGQGGRGWATGATEPAAASGAVAPAGVSLAGVTAPAVSPGSPSALHCTSGCCDTSCSTRFSTAGRCSPVTRGLSAPDRSPRPIAEARHGLRSRAGVSSATCHQHPHGRSSSVDPCPSQKVLCPARLRSCAAWHMFAPHLSASSQR